MFGVTIVPFNAPTLLKILHEEVNIPKAQKYINSYLRKIMNPNGALFWKADTQEIIPYNKHDIIMNFFYKDTTIVSVITYDEEKDKNIKGKFNAKEWFFSNANPTYTQTFRTDKPVIFEEYRIEYINRYKPPKHSPLVETKYTKKVVQKVLDHLFNVICRRNKKKYFYVHDWIVNVIAGKKMFYSSLYINMPEGISPFFNFIADKVIGKRNSYISTRDKSINSAEILGKILVVLQEVNEIDQDSLRNAIYSRNIVDDKLITDNVSNFVMISNSFRRLERSYVFTFECNDYGLGNYDNFDVGEAFYWYAINYVKNNSEFDDSKMPRLNFVIDYIKKAYVRKGKGIEMSFDRFCDKYRKYLNGEEIDFHNLLDVLRDVFGVRSTSLKISIKKLEKIYRGRGWIK